MLCDIEHSRVDLTLVGSHIVPLLFYRQLVADTSPQGFGRAVAPLGVGANRFMVAFDLGDG
jgi:hypothetical protein